jgi:hypothetical protein
VRSCLHCGTDLDSIGKNRKAIYCNTTCKNAYRKFRTPEAMYAKQKEYFDTHTGRAIRLFHTAKRREPENFELTVEWISNKIQAGFCEVTGLPFVYRDLSGRQPWVPSLDKLNPDIGYTLENTRVVVWMYNAAKNVYTDEEVLFMAHALIRNKDGSMRSETSKRERKAK